MHKMKYISADLKSLLKAKSTHFDAMVIGSGYGGGVSALRLAQTGRTVCLLERGREILPGQYPDTPQKAARNFQITTAQAGPLPEPEADQARKPNNGLFDIRIHDDMSVIIGCGLGGTSLINANVALEPDKRVFQNGRWPKVFADPKTLRPYYDLAATELGSNPLPKRYHPNKLKALEVSAEGFKLKAERAPINVTFEDKTDPKTGVFQPACNMCGDCCSGCNYGSKNTTLMNYLPRAHAAGATIITEARVYTIEELDPGNGPWTLVVEDMSGEKITRHNLTADVVVLAAGSLGSTEILLRSREKGLKTSDKLGEGFSGNGDVIGFGFDAFWNNTVNDGKDPQLPIYGVGAGVNRPDVPVFQPGPCITGVIKVDMDDKDYTKGLVIQEGVAPGAISLAMPMGLFMQQALNGDFMRFPDVEKRLRDAQSVGDLFAGGQAAKASDGDTTQALSMMAYSGATSETQTFLAMSHDDANGKLEMNAKTDCVVVNWPNVGDQKNYVNVNDKLREASDSIWANYLPNPLWRPRFGRKLITVHPVGGCSMGDNSQTGVVDDACRVFTGHGTDVHEGLYVCDGAVMSSSIGLNPLLTITAVSERAMAIFKKTRPFNRPSKTLAKIEPIERVPAEEVQAALMVPFLRKQIDQFTGWQTQIKAKQYEKVRAEIITAIKAVFPKEDKENFWKGFKGKIFNLTLNTGLSDAELVTDIDPALGYIADVLTTLTDLIERGEPIEAAKFLEKECGDYSPDLAFSETMRGHICKPREEHAEALSNRYEVSAKYGEAKGQTLVADFHVVANSLKELTDNPLHEANLTGQILVPYISDEPLEIQPGGKFNLLIADKGEIETWKMVYACQIKAENSDKTYYFHGAKTLVRKHGSNWWTDLSTLSVDLFEGPDPSGKPIAMGIITLSVQDLLKQLSTVTSDYRDEQDNHILTTLAGDALFWGDLRQDLKDKSKRQELLRKLIGISTVAQNGAMTFQVSAYFLMKFAGFFGMVVFRAYGEMLAYLYNFQGRARLEHKVTELPKLDGAKLRKLEVQSSSHWLPNDRERTLHLTRYDAREDIFATNRTVILAPGFATRAASFAMETVEQNLVDALCQEGYDVWLFDYRSSPLLASSLKPFTLDDVAKTDWPMAVDYIREEARVQDMQAVVHCMGSMTHLMALLNGMKGIRSVVSSQLTLHPVTNWFNKFKADTYIATLLRQGLPDNLLPMADALAPNRAVADLFRGVPTVNANALVVEDEEEPGKFMQDQVINMMTWEVPFPNDAPCYSPTCHRIFGIYGPVFAHEQLNEETHNAIQTVFGSLSTEPFRHMAEVVRQGIAVDENGANTYLENYENLRLPITFLAGALNQEFMPDTSLRTLNWLKAVNKKQADKKFYDRFVWEDYAHMDFFLGKNAHEHIYPDIIKALQNHDRILGKRTS